MAKEPVRRALAEGVPCRMSVEVKNTDRAFGALLGAEITRHSPDGWAEDALILDCTGAGGQALGRFCPRASPWPSPARATTTSAKGFPAASWCCGRTKKPATPPRRTSSGNVALYGATSGQAYINGMAGERFCVRNSGAAAVVEGVGEHGCEYMTGGRVVVLGPIGKNFAAGMSGGVAYVLDEESTLYRNLNKSMVSMEKVESKFDREELYRLIDAHVQHTGSPKGRRILAAFSEYLPRFKRSFPTTTSGWSSSPPSSRSRA